MKVLENAFIKKDKEEVEQKIQSWLHGYKYKWENRKLIKISRIEDKKLNELVSKELQKFRKQLEQTVSPRTQIVYLKFVHEILKASKSTDISKIKPNIEKFLSGQMSKSTRSLKNGALSSYLRWKHNINNPKVVPPELENITLSVYKDFNTNKREKTVPTAKDIDKVIGTLSLRNGCMLGFLAATGFRIREALAIRMKDITLMEDGTVEVKCTYSKTEKGKRTVYMIEYVHLLKDWIKSHPLNNNSDFYKSDVLLFITTKTHQPLMYQNIYNMIKDKFKAIGIKGVGCHSLRHYRIDSLLKKGFSLREVQTVSGHMSVEMVSGYAHTQAIDIKNKEMGKEEEKFINCPRCEFSNSIKLDFCTRCNVPLKEKMIFNRDKETKDLKDVIKEMKEQMFLFKKRQEEMEENIWAEAKGEKFSDLEKWEKKELAKKKNGN